MNFQRSEAQVLLSDGARRYVEKNFDYETRRKALAGGEAYSVERWRHMADMGWLALVLPEAHGGLDGTPADYAILMESIGGGLLPEPLVPVVQAARLLLATGGADDLLAATAIGEARPVIAHGEIAAGGCLSHVEARADRTGGGWRLTGTKALVLGGAAATHYVLSARTSGATGDEVGISLFLLPADHPDLGRRDIRLTDDSFGSDLRFANLNLPTDALLGQEGEGFGPLREGMAWLQLGLHAEALGAMDKAMWTTRDYVRTRQQFGTTLSTFQAVQHRLADMAMEIEMARSMLFRLLAAFTRDSRTLDRILAAAKARFGEAGFFVGAQSVQLHGGMGMADDYVIGML
ncbi:acyl-CoA dehydrogenase family protein, partial [Sphingobium sp.]|uniref:acyl-CoA dehydrogenase family protein n=1 Tax=Sphingobium sp. TaxID=1912891 RepID=UPI002BE8F606